MRKVTQDIASAFLARIPRTISNSHTDGERLFLHGNEIARHGEHNGRQGVFLTQAGWSSPTTRERLNGLLEAMGHKRAQGCLGYSQKNYDQRFGIHYYDECADLPKVDLSISPSDTLFVPVVSECPTDKPITILDIVNMTALGETC